MLPSVTGLIMGGRAPTGILIRKPPKWLSLEIAAMARRASLPVHLFPALHGGAIVGVGEVRRSGLRAEERLHESRDDRKGRKNNNDLDDGPPRTRRIVAYPMKGR